MESLEEQFPNASAVDLEAVYSKTGKLQVKMNGYGKKAYNLFTVERGTNTQRLNPNLPKEIKNSLGPERSELIQQKDSEIAEIYRSVEEDCEILNDKSAEPSIQERAREKIEEKVAQRSALENERERLEKGLSLHERVKEIFKKIWLHRYCGFGCCWHNNWCYHQLSHKRPEICC